MGQVIEYQGEADIAVLGLCRELLRPDRWSRGEWYIEVEYAPLWEDGKDEPSVVKIVRGHLEALEDMVPDRDGAGFHGEIVIQPWDADKDEAAGAELVICTDDIWKIIVP